MVFLAVGITLAKAQRMNKWVMAGNAGRIQEAY